MNRLERRISARSRDDLAAFVGLFRHELDHIVVFAICERRGLTGRADRNEAGHAARDLLFDDDAQRVEIHLSVPERRDQCGITTCKLHWKCSFVDVCTKILFSYYIII